MNRKGAEAPSPKLLRVVVVLRASASQRLENLLSIDDFSDKRSLVGCGFAARAHRNPQMSFFAFISREVERCFRCRIPFVSFQKFAKRLAAREATGPKAAQRTACFSRLSIASNDAREPFPRKPSGRRVFLPAASVGSAVAARRGDAPASPPPSSVAGLPRRMGWPRPKSLAAGRHRISQQALRHYPSRDPLVE